MELLPTATACVSPAGPTTVFLLFTMLSHCHLYEKPRGRQDTTPCRMSQGDPETVILTGGAGAVPPAPRRSVRTCGCPHTTEGSVHLGCSGRLRGTRVPGTRGREGAAADSLGTDHGRSATHSRRGCGPFSPSPTCWEWKGQMAERERERPSSPDHLGAGYAGNYSSFTRNRQWGSLTLKRSLFGHLSSW